MIKVILTTAAALNNLDTLLRLALAGGEIDFAKIDEARDHTVGCLDELGTEVPDLELDVSPGVWPHAADRTPSSVYRLLYAGALVGELGYLADGLNRLAREMEADVTNPLCLTREVALSLPACGPLAVKIDGARTLDEARTVLRGLPPDVIGKLPGRVQARVLHARDVFARRAPAAPAQPPTPAPATTKDAPAAKKAPR